MITNKNVFVGLNNFCSVEFHIFMTDWTLCQSFRVIEKKVESQHIIVYGHDMTIEDFKVWRAFVQNVKKRLQISMTVPNATIKVTLRN